MSDLLLNTEKGLYCPAGGFYVDPWAPVDRAVVTHAHSDHAHFGSRRYLSSREGAELLRLRLGSEIDLQTLDYDEPLTIGGVRVSLHPAGHILGSSQVRLEQHGQVWVVSGDYKTAADPTCTPLEPVRCHTFVTESTFGLPIYRWPPAEHVLADVHAWWQENQRRKRTSVLFAYALGKAQRLLAGLDGSLGPILVHGAIERLLPAYRAAGIQLAACEHATAENSREHRGRALVLAPPSAMGSAWLRKFGALSPALASGWMQIRGARRRRAMDRGFVLSDHADWDGLLTTIAATGAQQVWVTHGHVGPMVHWLTEQGLDARAVVTRFEGELDEVGGGVELDEPVGAG
jgi:putative mRNA 3-end processing factor